jgi:MFS family permease
MTPHVADSRYAWFRLGISLALSTLGGIGLWAPIVALPTIQQEFGVDRSGASFPYTLTMVGFAMGGVLMGKVADKFGIMAPLFVGTILLCAGFVGSAYAPNYWFYVAMQAGVIGLFGVATTFGPLVADVSLWFKKRRGIAVGIVASGNYLAGAIWSPILTSAIAEYGWRTSFKFIGVGCLVTMLPLTFFMRRRASVLELPTSAKISHPYSGTPALQALLVLAGLACCVAMSMPQVHISPIAVTLATAHLQALKCSP